MRKVYLCLTVSLVLAVLSCSKDDGNDIGLITVENDPTEEVSLNVNEVSKNIEIRGAIREQGNAPAPNGDITFTIDDSNQSAFQKNGFDIKLQAPENYAGVYIQLKSEDGVASEYFDVPAGAGKSTKKNVKNRRVFTTKNQQLVDNEVEIDVDFINVPPGKFCYLICIYDGDGNVSAPAEVCVEVEAWGGNPNLVGTWDYTKQVRNGKTFPVGEVNFCEGPESIICENGSTLIVAEEDAWCYATTEMSLELKENGTYVLKEKSLQKQDLNMEESRNTCSVVNEQINDEFGSLDTNKGNWAYDEEENTLYLIGFEFLSIYFEDDYEDNYFSENGELDYLSGAIEFSNASLKIKVENDFFNTQVDYYFEK